MTNNPQQQQPGVAPRNLDGRSCGPSRPLRCSP
jgi:hypothetical protein